MKNIIFIAPPAAGKGTYSNLLEDKYGYNHISAGNVLREEISNKTETGNKIAELVNKGELVDNRIIKELLNNKFKKMDKTIPFIMDGYPRTLNQVKDFEEILLNNNLEIGKIIYLNIPKEVGLNRILNRRVCPKCKAVYSKLEKTICPVCGIKLITRADDTEKVYLERYETYEKETKPLLNYYNKSGKLVEIDATIGIDDTLKEIEKWLV